MARTCCSNWLVTAASNVRWPELCGRGASSLTSSSPSVLTKNSTHSTPTYCSSSRIARVISTACFAIAGGMRGGRRRHVEDVVDDAGSRTARTRSISPSSPRAATTEISACRLMNFSTTASWWPMRVPDVLDVGRRGHLVLPLAVVAERRGLDDRGRADLRRPRPTARRAWPRARTAPSESRGRRGTSSRARAAAPCAAPRRTAAPARAPRSRRSPRSARSRTRR